MAKNVTIAGAAYSAVPSIDVPQTGGGTASFFDVSGTTATAADVAQGKVFYAADGTETTGTASGGGGASYTLLHSEVVSVSTTSTSASNVKTINLDPDLFFAKMVYVRIRDTAGPRAGYFYGTDTFFLDYGAASETGAVSTLSTPPHTCLRVTSDGEYAMYTGATTTNYGVFAYSLQSANSGLGTAGNLVIRRRYNSSYSLTISSDYRIDVYAVDAFGDVPYFEPLE